MNIRFKGVWVVLKLGFYEGGGGGEECADDYPQQARVISCGGISFT